MGLWTKEHAYTLIPAVIVMLAASMVLRHFLKDKAEKYRLLPIQIIAVLLVVLEFGKQGFHLIRGYDLYALPFHVCSLALFMLPAMAFYRGKHDGTVRSITSAICVAITLLLLIYPSLIYSGGNVVNFFKDFLDFHTVAFHNLVIFACMLIFALNLYAPREKGEGKAVALFHGGFCLVSATMAMVLKTNYANFYECNIPVFESIREGLQPVLGYWPTQLIYIAILSVLTVAFMLMSWQICRLVRYLTKKKTAAAT